MKNEMNQENHEDSDIEFYGDPDIATKNAPVPKWLKWNNWFWVFFGFVWLYLFWNGSYGWFDRGYWNQLQRAANTVYPFTTAEIIQKENQKAKEYPEEKSP